MDTRIIQELPRFYIIGLCALGAFSRFTHGRYTPTFYRYQIDHAPDDDSTRFVPFIDATLGAMLLLGGPRTQTVGALVRTLFQAIGILGQWKKGKADNLGVLSFCMAAATGWLSWAR
jgi:hypothetical protein